MAARKIRRKAVPKRQGFVAALIGVLTLLLVYSLVALSVTPVKYDIKAGDVAPATITASREITDTVTTDQLKAQAIAAVSPMYSSNEESTRAVKDNISAFFDNMLPVLDYVKQEYIDQEIRNSIYSVSRESLEQNYDPTDVDWEMYLGAVNLTTMRTMTDEGLSDELLYAMAALTETQVLSYKSDVASIVDNSLDKGIKSEHLETEKEALKREIEALTQEQDTAKLLVFPVDKHLKANLVRDDFATRQAEIIAEQNVTPVIYMQSQTVVVEGEIVTEAQMIVLSDLGVIGGETTDFKLYVGTLLFVILLMGVYTVYLHQFEKEIIKDTRKLLILAVIIVLVAAISVPLARLDYRILPVFFGTMLASVLVSRKSGLALGVFLSFIAGAICSWNQGILSGIMIRTVLMTVIGGSVAVFALNKPGHRTTIIFAGFAAGLVNALIAVLINMIGSVELVWENVWTDSAFALGSGVLAGVLAIGTLPVWEAVFRVSTPTKLLELSNPNHPLLKRLTLEAPGTYHHSMLVANLAEAGADAVGANSLLCRVGAYFHDIGKLDNPVYFKENQKGENPHDQLPPAKSAKIITDHLKSGMEYAQQYRLPRDVQKIISQHHGDGYVEYFVYKAKQAGEKINDAIYKYSGIKPQTKEAAVVMLADTVEAAVRSMDSPNKEQVKEMINGLIRKKYNEGQLDECPLNRRDLNTIAKAFLSTFEGALHERVKYPGQEQ